MDLAYTVFYLIGDPFHFIPDKKFNIIANLMVRQHDSIQYIKDENLNKIAKLNKTDHPTYLARFMDNHNDGRVYWQSPPFTQEKYEKAIQEGSLFGLGFFPWDTKLTSVGYGTYTGVAPHLGQKIGWRQLRSRNPYTGHNLTIKLKTIGMLTINGLISYYSIRLLISRIM